LASQYKQTKAGHDIPVFIYEEELDEFGYFSIETLENPIWIEFQCMASIARWSLMVKTSAAGVLGITIFAGEKKSSYSFATEERFLRFVKAAMQEVVKEAGKVNSQAVLAERKLAK